MALVITRKVRTILLIVLGVLVIGGGAFLIWRVTREETVAPEDSEASAQSVCEDKGCYWHVPTGTCTEPIIGCVFKSDCANNTCGDYGGNYGACAGVERSASGIPMCCALCDSGDECTGCSCIVTCSGSYPLESCPAGHNCSTTTKTCIKVDSCGDPCGGQNSKTCYKDNGAIVTNTCEGGSWLDKPTGEYPYGTSLNPITIQTIDKDGLGSVTVKVNSNTISSCIGIDGATCYDKDDKDIKIYISPGQQYIGAGTYNLVVTWKDGKEVGGDKCTKSTTFTISQEVVPAACSALAKTYPYTATQWSPTGIGFCKEGSSATPNYTELMASFPEPGETVKWVCKNAQGSVNCQASRADINDPSCGTLATNYSSDITTWPTGTFCTVGTVIPSSPLFPTTGGTTQWTCGIGFIDPLSSDPDKEVSCIATRDNISGGSSVPQTGIFDTVLAKVSLGISFIFLGGLVSQYSRINYFFNSVSQKNEFRREVREQRKEKRRVQKEEKRAIKRRDSLEERFR
jgi:hypothetical protein